MLSHLDVFMCPVPLSLQMLIWVGRASASHESYSRACVWAPGAPSPCQLSHVARVLFHTLQAKHTDMTQHFTPQPLIMFIQDQQIIT